MVIVDGEGRFLTVRQRGGAFKDAWLLPGGGLEPGESTEDAVRREVREETGLEVLSLRFLRRYEVRADGTESYYGHTDVFTGETTGTPRSAHTLEPIEWITPHEDLHPLLLRELADAGLLAMEAPEIERRCAEARLSITALGGAEHPA